MVNIKINNKELTVSKDLTILQAASLADIQIPRFCYHEKLTIAGNCRMCLVEMAKVNKPVASCALPVSEGMQVYTNSILVKKAREGVLELLLANHPLDCPICDQGGECDLQEQAMIFGNDRSRFYETKRAVSDKTISPFVKTIMTRCIHCTRCVRFLNEIAGVNELGMTGRGAASEIGTYISNSISSEMSGNIIDLCPVGALTSKPYAFTARPWELRSIETIDIFDQIGANIKVDVRGPNLMRILPKINEFVNEEWITDKTRFSFDGYKMQRLNAPMFSQDLFYKYKFNNLTIKQNNKIFLSCTWLDAFNIFKEYFNFYNKKQSNSNIILGNQINIESANLLKILYNKLEFKNIFSQYELLTKQTSTNYDFTHRYSLNVNKKMEKVDVCLLVGVNLRVENPLLNSRLRKTFLLNNTQIGIIGPFTAPTYNIKKLGNSSVSLLNLIEGRNSFTSTLLNAKNPLIIVGTTNSFSKKLINSVHSQFENRKKKIEIIQLNVSLNQYILDDLCIFNSFNNLTKNNFNLLLQADELKINKKLENFNVYIGFQSDRLANESDLILPSMSPLEETGTYFDINGNLIKTNACLPAPYGSRTTWKIILALLQYFKHDVNIKDNNNQNIKNFSLTNNNKELIPFNVPHVIYNNFINNYYKTNSVTRNSRIMSQMTKQKNDNIRF